MKQLARSTIQKELRLVQKELKRLPLRSQRRDELYGIQQTLIWVLGEPNTMRPLKSAML